MVDLFGLVILHDEGVDLFLADLDPRVYHVLELIALLVVLAGLVTIGVKFLSKIRPRPIQQELSTSELLSKYREMHSRGELSDVEFRTIKTKLTERMQNELRDDGQKGCDT